MADAADVTMECLGPVTIWTPVTERGRQLLRHSVGAWEAKPDGSVTVESRRNPDIQRAFREAGLVVADVPWGT